MKSFKWLHFSDLHLSCNSIDATTAKNKLKEFIKQERELNKLEYDYIFITGDIANQAVYEGTQEFLEDFFGALGLENSNQGLKNVFWSVGNHDINRDEKSERYQLIQEIRNSEKPLTLAKCIDPEPKKPYSKIAKKTTFVDEGMALFMDMHTKILKRNYETNRNEPHIFVPLPELNLIILNTCLTSVDNNDTHNLYIKSKDLEDVFEKIEDKNKPIFVLGHHGRDFFEMGDMDKLSTIFDDSGVDLYLCGHNHMLGFALFPDTQRNIYQLTCGGGDKFSNGTCFSFMHGEFNGNDGSIHITPYSYRESGDKGWGIDNRLHRRLKSDVSFPLERLVDFINKKPAVVASFNDAWNEVATTMGMDDLPYCDNNDSDYVNILHLSDLQFGITKELSGKSDVAIAERMEVLEKKLLDHLKTEIPKEWMPDIIVVSGDLAWSATKSDYKKFGDWLKELLGVLNLPMERVILCTGNHDITAYAAEANNSIEKEELPEKAKTELIPDAPEIAKIYGKFNEFISFCKGEVDEEIIFEPLNNILPDKSDGKYLYGFRDLLGIRFNVLNTSWYCGDNKKKKDSHSDKENLWIGTGFVQDLDHNLIDNDKFSITVFHHPFDWLHQDEGNDNAYVKQRLLKLSDIILCGHVHTQVGEPTFEHNRTQIFQSGALWNNTEYTYESRIIRINKRTHKINQLTIEYIIDKEAEQGWNTKIRKGPNLDYSYPYNFTKHQNGKFVGNRTGGKVL